MCESDVQMVPIEIRPVTITKILLLDMIFGRGSDLKKKKKKCLMLRQEEASAHMGADQFRPLVVI